MRAIVNAIFYILRGGVAWSLLPRDFPPSSKDLEATIGSVEAFFYAAASVLVLRRLAR